MSNTIIQVNQELIHNEWKDLVRNSVEETLNALLDHEADQLVNAGKYERSGDRKGYRSGHYQRHFQTTSGEVTLKVPKLIGTVCYSCWMGMIRGNIYVQMDQTIPTLYPDESWHWANDTQMSYFSAAW